MVEIKQNDYNEEKEFEDVVISNIIDTLEVQDTCFVYRASTGLSAMIAKRIADKFVKKGYHAKLIFFTLNDALQSLVVSKKPLEDTHAAAVYSEMIG